MGLKEKKGCLVNQVQGEERAYLAHLDQWDKKEIQEEMDMQVFLENLDKKVSLDCLAEMEQEV